MTNGIGRTIPGEIPGYKKVVPYSFNYGRVSLPGKAQAYTGKNLPGDKKILPDIETAIKECGLEDGMTVSFHHHFRNGDRVVNLVLERAARMGLKGLKVALTSIFPVHEPLVEHISKGVVGGLSCNYMLGPVAEAMSGGAYPFPVIFRTHGGRDRAVEAGEEKIDVAFIAASAADEAGNFNGVSGSSACGSLGYCLNDCHYARRVVVLTDNIEPYPLIPASADETMVDYVVKVDRVGDPAGITTGAVRAVQDPLRLQLAQWAADVIEAAGLLKEGVSFQTGTGGASLAAARFLREKMEYSGIIGSFGMGGITGQMADLLREGFFKAILDTQSFDQSAIASLRDNPRHLEISSSRYANPHNKGCAVNRLDAMILSATEVDTDFNVNVHTASDGRVMGGSGGHADTAAGSKLAVVVAPSVRKNIPIVIDRVLTVTTPGATVDCLVTERGISVNPERADLKEHLRAAGLPLLDIEDQKRAVEKETGSPRKPALSDKIVALVEYRDGTVIDVIKGVLT
ncbi:MAG: citrate lyase subunit alpha [Bacillota bacterium]